MKYRRFLCLFIAFFVAEIAALIFFMSRNVDDRQDVVSVNEALQSVQADFDEMERHQNVTALDYTVLDKDGAVLFQTALGLSGNINEAVIHRDTVLDIEREGTVVGKMIIYNDASQMRDDHRRRIAAVFIFASIVQCGCCVGYLFYINRHVKKPFRKLERFAENVAGGNLDIPLEMDRQNLFGAFTESFDIMRSELKKARLAEARANASKKELIAQLSHDIRTPVSSILAASEVGAATTDNEKDRQNYMHIIHKADQIGTLVTNLFSATLEELQQLTVEPADMESGELTGMLLDADYFHYSEIPPVPDCLIFADKVRLQQVFDNLFSNSYKYANTKIDVAITVTEAYLTVRIEDHGGGVLAEELPRLKEKFRRGSNSNKMEGAGLGLYISDCFMKEMQGALVIENGADGLAATVRIPLSGSVRFKEFLRNA